MSGAGEDRRELLTGAIRQLRAARAHMEEAERARREPVAVIGAGVRLPGGVEDLDAFWKLLEDGTDAVTARVDGDDGRRHLSADPPSHGRWAGHLSTVESFDAEFFGIGEHEAAHVDPQQRLVLEVAWEAIEDAGLPLERLRSSDTGVFLGLYGSDYLALQLANPDAITAYTGTGGALSIAANRLSYLLDLHGPSLSVDTACSSSLYALHLACRALRQGDCELALVGGANVIASPLATLVAEKVDRTLPAVRCGRRRHRARGGLRDAGAAAGRGRAGRERPDPGPDPRHGGQPGRPIERSDGAESGCAERAAPARAR